MCIDIWREYLYNGAMEERKRIFLDYASGTPVSQCAQQAYSDALQYFANPAALHTDGLEAARVLDDARKKTAETLGVRASELVYTSGGTESNNVALKGYIHALEKSGRDIATMHVVVSAIEHPSVLAVLDALKQYGLTVSTVAPNTHGEVTPEAVAKELCAETVLVSVALVNSEIGTVQPLRAIAKVVRMHEQQHGTSIAFHTDASQSLYLSVMPHGLGVDLVTLDSGKMYGPRGVGVLYVRQGVALTPVLYGGSQERGLRPGTENVAGAVGFAKALIEATERRDEEKERLASIRMLLYTELVNVVPDIVCNGDASHQAPHILNVSIPKIDAEYVAMYLDQRGVAVSTKSACLERTGSEVSAVVRALCTEDDAWRAHTAIRFSFGKDTHKEEIHDVVKLMHEAVETYRSFAK